MKDNRMRGLWFLEKSSEEANKILGELTYSKNEGARLELITSFTENIEDGEYESIYGIIENGKKVTLRNSFTMNISLGNLGFEEIYTNSAYIGSEFIEDYKFHKIEAEVMYLNKWLYNKNFKIENSFFDKGDELTPIQLKKREIRLIIEYNTV